MPCSSIQARVLLQETAEILASSPASTQNVNTLDANAHFSPTMAIILIILVAAFFFMAFFSIYVKRCSSRQIDHHPRAAPADLPDIPSQGVDAAFLQTLPLVAYSSSKKKGSNIECVVCLVDFEEGEPLCQLPRCKHVFHKECIDMWLFSHSTCPLCRHCVIADGTRSFRWGGGSGRLGLSLGLRGSRRGSGRGSAPATMDGQGRMAEHGDGGGLLGNQLLRSHSTGHSLATSTAIAEEAAAVQLGYLPLMQQPAAFQRSRSVAVMAGGGGVPLKIGIGDRMREAGAPFQRAVSLKNLRQAGASSSSTTASVPAPTPSDRIQEHALLP